jgi:hypothetical protein
MDRRSVIKQMALSGGVVLSSGSILALLQSCKSNNISLGWTPKYFSVSDMSIISAIANEIMPKDDMPSATDVAVPQFIDLLFLDVFDKNFGQEFKAGINEFSNNYQSKHNQRFEQASPLDKGAFVRSLYNLGEQDKKNIFELLENKKVPDKFQNLYVLYRFLTSLRDLTIDAYFTSELIGEKYLAYDPIPGSFVVDFPVDESTKVWSL